MLLLVKVFYNKVLLYFVVPSAPPENVTSWNTSSTSLMVAWAPVPTLLVHGLVRGYIVSYCKATGQRWCYTNTTTTDLHVQLNNLEKFTLYFVRVLAFNQKGRGPSSNNLTVSTAEDGK